jgi:CubicO group peptidase (beta-lactamase class C family)
MVAFLAGVYANFAQAHPKLKPDYSAEQIERMAPELTREIDAIRRETKCPGLEALVVKDDKVVFMKALGWRDVEKRLPMTTTSQTMIASCSKAFNATAVMLAAEEGKLDLNDRPSRYLLYFKLKDTEANEKLTIWDLMNHVSGLPRTDSLGFTYGFKGDEWIRSIADAEPTYRYRENEQYSNVLVHTAGVIAAQVYGTTWPELIKAKIFDPLGMTHSSAGAPETLSEMAIPYDVDTRTGEVRKVPYSHIEDWGVACGGIKSCVQDLAPWIRAQLNHGILDGRQVLPAAVIDREHQPRFASQDLVDVASGWFVDHGFPTPIIGHSGALDGFLTNVALIPDRHLGIAVLTNSHGGAQGAVTAYLRRKLLGDSGLKDLNDFQFKARDLYTDPAHRDFERISFIGETGALSIARPGEPKVRLHRLEDWTKDRHVYVTADPRNRQVKVTFIKSGFDLEEAGKTTHYDLADRPDSAANTKELQAKQIEAYGGLKALTAPHNFTADFTNNYANEGFQTSGHWYHAWPERFSQWETFTTFGRKAGSSQSITTPHRAYSVATFSPTGDSPGFEPPVLSNASRICDAPDWRTRFAWVRVVGQTMLHGVSVFVVRKHPRFPTSALDVVDYVDAQTYRVARRELGPQDNPEDYSQAWEFADFQTIDGVQIPTTSINIDTGDHRVITRLTNLRPVDRLPEYYFRAYDFPTYKAEVVQIP